MLCATLPLRAWKGVVTEHKTPGITVANGCMWRTLPAQGSVPELQMDFLVLFPLHSPRENAVFKKRREDGEEGEKEDWEEGKKKTYTVLKHCYPYSQAF